MLSCRERLPIAQSGLGCFIDSGNSFGRGASGVLVLTRKPNQSIMIGDDIEITVLAIMGEKVRIGIQAPRSVPVFRREVYVEIQEDQDDVEERQNVDRALEGLKADTG
jgi:carbon storage regulator